MFTRHGEITPILPKIGTQQPCTSALGHALARLGRFAGRLMLDACADPTWQFQNTARRYAGVALDHNGDRTETVRENKRR